MKRDETNELMLCTVEELAKFLASKVNAKSVLANRFPNCDFAIVGDEEDSDDLEYIKSGASGWYGIKAIDTGFDSVGLILCADYYGGGCANFTQLWDDVAEILNGGISGAIQEILIGALELKETARPETKLIVEFEKGEE